MAQREWLEEFIQLYQSEPCLWKIKSKDYHNRVKKESAYEKLILKLREIDSKSNKEAVIKKINNLRCTYNKEHKKVMTSKSGSGAQDIYEPKLWYYSLLRFLDDQNIPRSSRSNLDGTADEINVMESSGAASVSENEAEHSELEFSENLSAPSPTASTSTIASSGHDSAPKRLTKRKNNDDLTKEVLQSVQDHFKRPTYQEDRFDIIGKMVALKLREFKNKQQQLLAEKLINETLFEAEMGYLTMSHRVMAPRTMILNDFQSRSNTSNSIPSPPQSQNQSPISQSQYYHAVTLAPRRTTAEYNIPSQTNTSSYDQEIQETQTINAMNATTVQLSLPDWTEETAKSYVSRFSTNNDTH